MRRPICVLIAILLLLTCLQAHDLYLLPAQFHTAKGSKISIAFHNGDSFPASEVAPKVARLLGGAVAGKAGSAPIEHLAESGKETIGRAVVPASGTLIVSVRTAPNFIELEPKKFEAYLEEEGLQDIIAWRKQNGEEAKPGRERYSKYAKSLVVSGRADDYYNHELGFPIEIIPLADPSVIKPGSKLPVRVLFRGKPVQGLQVESAWASGSEGKTTIAGRTDVNGRAEVEISKAGLWRLHSLKMERCTDQNAANWESFWASLTFEVKGN